MQRFDFQGEALVASSRKPVNWFWLIAPWSSFLKRLGWDRVGWGVWMLPRAENYAAFTFPADLLLVWDVWTRVHTQFFLLFPQPCRASFLLKGIKLSFFSSQGLLGLPVATATATSLLCPAQSLIYMPGHSPRHHWLLQLCYPAANALKACTGVETSMAGCQSWFLKSQSPLRLLPFAGVSCFPRAARKHDTKAWPWWLENLLQQGGSPKNSNVTDLGTHVSPEEFHNYPGNSRVKPDWDCCLCCPNVRLHWVIWGTGENAGVDPSESQALADQWLLALGLCWVRQGKLLSSIQCSLDSSEIIGTQH
jgi:hypothetical protein